VEVFALASTLLILLPMALWVTSITDGRAGMRALFSRVFRWRFGVGWWLVVLFGLPVIALLLGLIFGSSLQTEPSRVSCRIVSGQKGCDYAEALRRRSQGSGGAVGHRTQG
jgi:hypothetical protein